MTYVSIQMCSSSQQLDYGLILGFSSMIGNLSATSDSQTTILLLSTEGLSTGAAVGVSLTPAFCLLLMVN